MEFRLGRSKTRNSAAMKIQPDDTDFAQYEKIIKVTKTEQMTVPNLQEDSTHTLMNLLYSPGELVLKNVRRDYLCDLYVLCEIDSASSLTAPQLVVMGG